MFLRLPPGGEKVLQYFAVTIALLSVLSAFSSAHPLFDSIGVGWHIYTILLAISLLGVSKGIRILVGATLLMNIIFLAPYFLAQKEVSNGNFTIYQHNLFFENDGKKIHRAIEKHDPDVLTLQELRQGIDHLNSYPQYKYKEVCSFGAIGSVAIYSKHKILKKGCSEGRYRGFAWSQVETKHGKKITLVSMHLEWPFPYKQSEQIEELVPLLKTLPHPVVLAGDFNQMPWSHTARAISHAIGGSLQNPFMVTFENPPLYLSIDHVIAPFDVEVTRLDRHGSDHYALIAKMELKP